tara:strand:+ start:309 stop:1334 length:1026 start_codon:yes stop_codon:yes gene_type:complete
MNERNKQNRDVVRQMTSSQTPAEAKAQKSLTTANPDWITSDDKKSPRQKSHDSRRGVRQARESLAEKVLEAAPLQDLQTKRKRNLTGDYVPSHLRKKANANVASKHPRMSSVEAGAQAARISDHKDRRGVKKPKPKPDGLSFGRAGRYQDGDLNKKNPNVKRGAKLDTASNEIVRGARIALAEMVLEAVKRKNTAVQDLKPKDLNKLETGLKKAKPGRVAKATKRPPAPKKGKTNNKKSDVLMRAGSSSSNHPDYLKKKLYNRATKDGGYGKEGKPTAADTEVNQQGVRGHEAKIAKKKKKSDRQAKAQRMSNKIRTMRGLVPLMPGEKHSSNDKLGKTEN